MQVLAILVHQLRGFTLLLIGTKHSFKDQLALFSRDTLTNILKSDRIHSPLAAVDSEWSRCLMMSKMSLSHGMMSFAD